MDILAHPTNRAGRELLQVYRQVLKAVTADALVRKAVRLEGDILRIAGLSVRLSDYRRVAVLGAGKASAAMAVTLEDILGGRIESGVVVTKEGHAEPLHRIRLLEAAHPVPDQRSLAAGAAIADLASSLGEGDLAIVLISGGASALMELPAGDLTLADLQQTNTALLRCGATIEEINAVRSRLSRIKAGGLARLLAPARAVCLVLSDVLGNPLHVIGSGPCWTAAPAGIRPADVVERYRLQEVLPASVLRLLQAAADCPDLPPVEHFIIGDVRTALATARDALQAMGHAPLILTASLRGEARELGTLVGAMAADLPRLHEEAGIDSLILGGEPTVTVRGDGRGGRCMEMAAAAALAMEGTKAVAVLSAGTDGTDGPTDAAGALVDGATAPHARESGYPLPEALHSNDTYPALDAVGALIRTGPTGSNVNDVVLLLHAPDP